MVMALFSMWEFWAIVVAVIALGAYKGMPFLPKVVKALGGQKQAQWIAVIGVLITSGLLVGFFGSTASIGAGTTAGSGSVASLHSISVSAGGNCTVAEDTNKENLITMECDDVDSSETAGVGEAYVNFTLKRNGILAESCPITVTTGKFTSPSDTSDTTDYYILERNTKDEWEVYFTTTAGVPDTSDVQHETDVGFTEGTKDVTVYTLIEIDEQASDELNQYDRVDIDFDFCGTPYKIEYMEMDAAA